MTSQYETALQRITKLVSSSSHQLEYNKSLFPRLFLARDIAGRARICGVDPSSLVECEVAFDLADRVEHLLNIPVSDRIRQILANQRTEQAALRIAEEVALGRFGFYDNKEEALDKGVRAGLAVVTEGVTVAPLQGITAVKIKSNDDNTNYASVCFAGPIRSAGGTEAAFTLVIADRIRLALGLDRYRPNGWGEDEIGRMVEELRIYEREVGTFQYKVTDQDIQQALLHLPVEVDGVETDPVEVVVHRGLRRIETDKVRGGALRVLNDGIIGRSRKLSRLLRDLSIQGWEWLSDLTSSLEGDSTGFKAERSHFGEVISGRPVLSFPRRTGGFRLRYGRSYNTGLSVVGVHPSVAAVLDYPIVVGTQVKVDIPGKAATIAFVDSIEPPVVKLKDGSVVRAHNVEYSIEIRDSLARVLYLGDMLVSYGDFLENNVRLPPSGYVDEWWTQDLLSHIERTYGTVHDCAVDTHISDEHLNGLLDASMSSYPTVSESFLLSEKLQLPLHPRYVFYWDLTSLNEITILRQKLTPVSRDPESCTVVAMYEAELKSILERIGIPHICKNDQIIIQGEDAYAVMRTLALGGEFDLTTEWKSIMNLLSHLSGVTVRSKLSAFIGVRVGRPEKAMLRKMKPPVHVLFPVGAKGGSMRDVVEAAKDDSFRTELINAVCTACGSNVVSFRCQKCGGEARIVKKCPNCNLGIQGEMCPACKVPGLPYAKIPYPLKKALQDAQDRMGYHISSPLKGVKGLMNATRIPEPLEKGLARKRYNLFVYKDGTVRFDVTNATLTHFRPSQIGTSITKLKELGYKNGVHGDLLESPDQILELRTQDVVLPFEAGECLTRVAKFVDNILVGLYGLEPYYNVDSNEDLVGHLVVGLAPHTSIGVLGRIIGFTNSQVCFAHPYWHSAKRRDCDGDEDSVMLLLDVLLNFSKDFLPAQIGGLMDTPLLLQPIVIPKEIQRQAHNFDVGKAYPVSFYEATLRNESPQNLVDLMDIVEKRLNDESQFEGFHFTHDTVLISLGRSRGIYSVLESTSEKLQRQIDLAMMLDAVDPDEVVSSVLKTHLLPDIIGNMNAYTSQKFRCKSCGAKYRRIPLKNVCLACGGQIQSTVTRGSVEKYLSLASKLLSRFDVDEYLRKRFEIINQELSTLFPSKRQSDQLRLTSFVE